MTMKKPPPPEEDEEQSRRFIETARELEADGDLNLTEGEAAFDRLLNKAAAPRRGNPSPRNDRES
jgi:hypothetical protein